ncbi:MAG: hypothetical protein WC501_02195 [Candidatus Micrarchaeia archaeon]
MRVIFFFAIFILFFGCLSFDDYPLEHNYSITSDKNNYSLVSNPDGSFNCTGTKEQYCLNDTLYYDVKCKDGSRQYGHQTCVYGCENSKCNDPTCPRAPKEQYCDKDTRFFNPECIGVEWNYEFEECPYGCLNGTCLEKSCPDSCDDSNPKTFDFCSNETNFDCNSILLEKNKQSYSWRYEGKSYNLILEFDPYLLIKYKNDPRFTCYEPCKNNWEEDYFNQFIFSKDQYPLIDNLILRVNESDSDRKLKILLRFVQSIPYDWEGFYSETDSQNFPYETLYYNSGVCSDKSLLGALIAKEMGYGSVLFYYEKENHMALGISCPKSLSNYNSGYCFIETTQECARFTDLSAEYYGNITLESIPDVYFVSKGKSLSYDAVMEDIGEIEKYQNALNKTDELILLMNKTSDVSVYNSYVEEYNNYVEVISNYCK